MILPPSMSNTCPATRAATSAFRDAGSVTSLSTLIAAELARIRPNIEGVVLATVFGAALVSGATAHDEQTMLR